MRNMDNAILVEKVKLSKEHLHDRFLRRVRMQDKILR
jgi:hypothetical protein